MSATFRRTGIERKILTSILWVGILPMTVALIVGYIAVRSGQTNTVQQTLLTAAGKAQGLEILISRRLNDANLIASDGKIVELLESRPRGSVPDSDANAVMDWLRHWFAAGINGDSCVSLYGADATLVASTQDGAAAASVPAELPAQFRDGLTSAEFRGFGRSPNLLPIVAPVKSSGDGTTIGYVLFETDVTPLLLYAVRRPGDTNGASQGTDFYQFVYIDEEGPSGTPIRVKIDFKKDAPEGTLPFTITPLDEILQAELLKGPIASSLLLHNYPSGDPEIIQDVLLAYHEMRAFGKPTRRAYLVVFRPASAVYSNLNRTAAIGLVCGIVFIAFLCVNAYRDVHNNIVRPISLLNEGAQIVRQGDFDLKLKIGTGDEIEELAQSFNKMAVALKQNIRQLEDSEEKYRSLVTSMRDGVYQVDEKGAITFLNPMGVETLGFPGLEDAVGADLELMFLDNVSLDPNSAELDAVEPGERKRLWMRRHDDRTICVELSRNRMFSEDGKRVGVEGIFRDVTKNVRLEEDARERSERIAAINQIANVINSSLEAGRLYESLVVELRKLVDCDYVAVALFGEESGKFEGRQLYPDRAMGPGYTFRLDVDRSSAAWVSRERNCLLVDNLRTGESLFADEFPEEIRSCLCVPLYAAGRIIGSLNLGARASSAFTKDDIANLEQMAPHLAVAIRNAQLLVNLQLSLEEVTRAREKLHAANEELKTLDEMKTNLLSNVSHELRTPLVSIMGYSDMILNGKAGPINNTQREYLEISLRNVEKLVTLIENLLDFSRLHRGDERLAFDTFDLVDCARTSMQIVQPVADGRNIRLELKADRKQILVDGEKGKMGQVFNNLLSNALKFNHNGGSVTIELSCTDTWVDVVVSDTGIGIPEDALDKVFTRFYQYDASTTRKYGGTGIGLSIVQDIVRLHGSTITVTSPPGEGAVFRFRLTLTTQRVGPSDGARVVFPSHKETHMLIQLVSADRALSQQLRNILESEGMDMIYASSASNAISLAQKYRPDCLLVDVDEGVETSDTLDELLREETVRDIPKLILTNDDSLYETYRPVVSARIKRSFRKSSLFGGIHHAISGRHSSGAPAGDRILCVDDDPEILTFIVRCLDAEGYRVDTCRSGESALELLDGAEYGLVLLDVAMPGMTGWDTCRRIRDNEEHAGIKVYMVSAKPLEQNLSKVSECGADGFLLKPFRPEDLIQLVQGLELQTVAS